MMYSDLNKDITVGLNRYLRSSKNALMKSEIAAAQQPKTSPTTSISVELSVLYILDSLGPAENSILNMELQEFFYNFR